ncbi:hypothetical protein GAH_00861 [Geoglobus ahangari]|uniref:Tubulin-like CetZ C-terminal domain-containing protein n=1 Tax=Geoglobus ahangari TaxID=113653 RepID=A0A0F7IFD3_9EURY|nr:hypothetical protein [Geoglobus ahangari]AKG91809.1 hypothetical protein GAH_00861 [Geoglobus ahangari]
MKLLTIGTGRASRIADIFASKGARVNNVNLFKTFAIVQSIDSLKSLRHVEDKRRFYAVYRDGEVDVRSAFNNILSFNELFEASFIICDLQDDFSYYTTLRLAEELYRTTEEPKLCLALAPPLESAENVNLTFMRVKSLLKAYDSLFLFETRDGFEDVLVKAFNVLSLVGEIDVRRRVSGEVVVDTSDFLNSLSREGVTVVAFNREVLPLKILRRLKRKSYSETVAERTERMVRMFDSSLLNTSARGELKSAKKALIVFSGDPDEITMDGIFECIKAVERMNPDILVRYGDYPVPNARELNVVVLFSGIKKFRL